jgi:hypothetical protein
MGIELYAITHYRVFIEVERRLATPKWYSVQAAIAWVISNQLGRSKVIGELGTTSCIHVATVIAEQQCTS